ncbi:dihydrofolate reductase [Pseudoprevotella muciniphila]|uniref:Dihydrofolate reductase n=1 Tax=Pseudoprevotella muciniphila TaxID=2133944 RepID=A0A5P8E5S0_9BACT|nr:dihydrofolate reductase [Pseudoprevotella muciniphila]QFQ12278.1 dihydrofolate reductase [Pseudoprevotella muciniphila]
MKKILTTMLIATSAVGATAQTDNFKYTDEQFADIQMLRYKVEDFDKLTLKQKTYVYYLTEAALQGRDILFDQNGRYNLRLRRAFEAIYTDWQGDRTSKDFEAFAVYLKRLWFSSGIHHHYGCEKFQADFSEAWLKDALMQVWQKKGLQSLCTADNAEALSAEAACTHFFNEIRPVIFDPAVMPMRVNQKDGDDLILTSAENYYGEGITQAEAEEFYTQRKPANDPRPVMMGLNSRLVKEDGVLRERVWREYGLYGTAITKIIENLEKAKPFADRPEQVKVIDRLIEYYRTGDLRTFDEYCILWLKDTESLVDFVNGFTESYGDPLGMKASWESIVNYKDLEATERTKKLSENAQWFEDNSPADPRFKKEKVKGISAKVITAAILGGDLYPSTAIGINLPNSDWVRREHGSKSVTISNLTGAYAKASHGSGFDEEFVIDQATRDLINKYGDNCDDLHTDLHECLGHGSGKLLPGTDPDTLKAYGSTIEEGRADIFALYYLADQKLVDLGLTPDLEAYKSQYYTYMMNGLMTQLVRIKPGNTIEEAHMRNRAFIAHWAYEHGKKDKVVELVKKKGKTYVRINDYAKLRDLFAELLAEVQRIKSEGDYEAARRLVEDYGVKVDPELHKEVLDRYARLNLKPYKGFINPVYTAVKDAKGNITDVKISYDESYDAQMLRYSRDYNTLPDIND